MCHHKTDFQVCPWHWGVLWSRSSRVLAVTHTWCGYPASEAPTFYLFCLYKPSLPLSVILLPCILSPPQSSETLQVPSCPHIFTHWLSKHSGDPIYLFLLFFCALLLMFSTHVAHRAHSIWKTLELQLQQQQQPSRITTRQNSPVLSLTAIFHPVWWCKITSLISWMSQRRCDASDRPRYPRVVSSSVCCRKVSFVHANA